MMLTRCPACQTVFRLRPEQRSHLRPRLLDAHCNPDQCNASGLVRNWYAGVLSRPLRLSGEQEIDLPFAKHVIDVI